MVYIHVLVTPKLCVRLSRAREGTSYSTGVVLCDDILDGRVGTGTKNNQSNDEDDGVEDAQGNVLGVCIPLALLDELEPEERRPVECESGDEKGGDKTEEGVEEGNGLGDDPSDDGDNGDESDPDTPALDVLDEADGRGGENAVHDVAADDGAVDGSGDEDDGERDTEGDAGDGVSGREKSRRLDLLADESVDESTGHGVDEDLNQTEGPDGLDVVLGGVHLRHERELADGEGVGEDDVGGRQESFVERSSGLRPRGPVDCAQSARGIVRLDTSCDDGEQDGGDDTNKVDVAQESEVVERGWQSKNQQDDHGYYTPYERACGVVSDDVDKGDCSGKRVRSNQQDEEEREHDTSEFLSEFTPDDFDGIRVVVDMRVAHLDLTDNVGCVDCDESKTDAHDDTRNHSEGCERARNTQRTKRNSFDNQADCELFPA